MSALFVIKKVLGPIVLHILKGKRTCYTLVLLKQGFFCNTLLRNEYKCDIEIKSEDKFYSILKLQFNDFPISKSITVQ